MSCREAEKRIVRIASMDKDQLVEAILGIDCGFPVDFSRAYLEGLSLEKLRHIYAALTGQSQRRPAANSEQAHLR